MDEHDQGERPGTDSNDEPGPAVDDRRPRFDDPEAWHDLAERGTPRNG
jgi:hypothetical protein